MAFIRTTESTERVSFVFLPTCSCLRLADENGVKISPASECVIFIWENYTANRRWQRSHSECDWLLIVVVSKSGSYWSRVQAWGGGEWQTIFHGHWVANKRSSKERTRRRRAVVCVCVCVHTCKVKYFHPACMYACLRVHTIGGDGDVSPHKPPHVCMCVHPIHTNGCSHKNAGDCICYY